MKSLWIVNKYCGSYHEKVFGKKATGGQWLDAMLDEAKNCENDSIVVVNIERDPKITYFKDGNISYYTINDTPNEKYDYKSQKAINDWKTIIDKEKPDIIEIWGTEFPYALAAMEAAGSIPYVIYVQGILDSIAKYYLSGLTNNELKKAVTLRDILTRSTIKQTKSAYEKRAEYEREISNKAGHIIIENEWAWAYYEKMCPGVTAHFLPISISESFCKYNWSAESMIAHTIMCPAANYPIKGLHMLLKALVIVKQSYPDVKLYVPGTAPRTLNSIKARLKQNGYDKLIRAMIDELELAENIIYTGRLTADEMAQKMSEVNCFVMCSAIENHSSTLKEAMTVGAPCVSSFVGGIGEYAKDGENCLLHRFEDYEVLANNICRIFEDKQLRQKLSQNAKETLRSPNQVCSYEKMRKIFEQIALSE